MTTKKNFPGYFVPFLRFKYLRKLFMAFIFFPPLFSLFWKFYLSIPNSPKSTLKKNYGNSYLLNSFLFFLFPVLLSSFFLSLLLFSLNSPVKPPLLEKGVYFDRIFPWSRRLKGLRKFRSTLLKRVEEMKVKISRPFFWSTCTKMSPLFGDDLYENVDPFWGRQ